MSSWAVHVPLPRTFPPESLCLKVPPPPTELGWIVSMPDPVISMVSPLSA